MKVVQTFWSKPLFKANNDVSRNRYNGGWRNYRYCLMSMAYSCLSISRYYPHLELYTDSCGVHLLRDIMKLPYHKFHVDLDDISNIDEALWAYGKIMTYSAQNEPFLHVDNDIFIWQEFPERVVKAELACQSMELINGYATDYQSALDYIHQNVANAPQLIKESKGETAANMGIFGGNNLDFIHKYCKEAKSAFGDMYDGIIRSGNLKGKFNIIYEQLLLTEYAEKEHQNITCLIRGGDLDEIVKYSTIETAQYESKYTHCLGQLKQYDYICEQIEYRLKYEYPSYYHHILSYLECDQKEYAENILSMDRYDDFEKIYSRISMASTVQEVMTDYKFMLKSGFYIEEEGEDYYMNSTQTKYKLIGWCKFLSLFLQANSGEAISKEIYEEKYIPELSFDKVYYNIFYLIMESLYITKCLMVA